MVIKMTSISIDETPVSWKRAGVYIRKGLVTIYDKQTKEKKKTRFFLKTQYTDPIISGPLMLNIEFFMPMPKSTPKRTKQDMLSGKIFHSKKPDIDNLLKYLLDCMTNIVFVDDAQVRMVQVKKTYSDNPRTELIVFPLEEQISLCI